MTAPTPAVTRLRVLVIESDDPVADAVAEMLCDHGHRPSRAATAMQAWARVRDADVVLMDLDLPDSDGLDVLRRLRRIADTPVLVLTARNTERDVVRALRLGADDYVVKPVRLGELLARVEAVARRARPAAAAADSTVVQIEDLVVDIGARRAAVAGREVTLTSTEFDILAALARRAGTALSRQQLLDEIWGDAYLAVSRSLDVHVARLRVKLGQPGLLTTIRGFGLRLG